jgi:hypothetical protein
MSAHFMSRGLTGLHTFALVAALSLLVVGCSAGGSGGVKVTYDKAADFSRLKTYSWLPGVMLGVAERGADENQVDGMIVKAIDDALAQQGYTRVAGGGETFRVKYQVIAETKVAMTYVDEPYVRSISGGLYNDAAVGMGSSAPVPMEYDVGTLIIDIVGPRESVLLWRGTASRTIRKDTAREERQQRINQTVQKMLANFPPTPGK